MKIKTNSATFAGLALCALVAATSQMQAFDNGQYEGIDPKTRAWFESVRSPHGVPCCSMADGHHTDYDARPDNHYWVPIEGEWRQVPTEAIVNNAGNPTGDAIVWYVKQDGVTIYIRCFVRPSEG